MEKTIMDLFTNPVKCKLLLEIKRCGHVTARRLLETLPDIPPATLYRYLKKLTADGILKIVRETQVRAVIEKTYALAIDLEEEFNGIIEHNSGEAYMNAFMQYMIGFAGQFQEYCKREDIDIKKDKSGFSLMPLYLTDQELEALVTSINRLIQSYRDTPPSPDRSLRSVGLIIAPPQKK